MTLSIHRTATAEAPGAEGAPEHPQRASRLVIGVKTFTVVMSLSAAVFTTLTAGHGWAQPWLAGAVVSFVLAGLGGTVLCLRAMLISRQAAYRRGHLDGWMRGWRGQEPGSDVPGLQ